MNATTTYRSNVATAWRSLGLKRTPRWSKAAFVLALLYVVSPVDLVPDIVPVLGWLDDVGVLGLATTLLLSSRPRTVDAARPSPSTRGRG